MQVLQIAVYCDLGRKNSQFPLGYRCKRPEDKELGNQSYTGGHHAMDGASFGLSRGAKLVNETNLFDWKSAVNSALLHSPSAVAVLDASGRVVFSNGAFERLTGFDTKRLQALDPPSLYRVTTAEASPTVEGASDVVELFHADGQPLRTSFMISPIYSADGSEEGHVWIQQASEESKQLRTELNNQRETLEVYGRLIESYSAQLRQAMNKLDRTLLFAVHALTSALDARDPYTAGHSFRVSHNASVLVSRLPNVNQDMIETVHVGALLHDIGKIGVPDSVLRKPGALTPEEYEMVKQHPAVGYNILAGIPDFEGAIAIVRSHHERLDGTGYPDGLKGEEIGLLVRCVSVCDIFDALTSARPYRAGMFPAEAIQVMQREAQNGWWDPVLVDMMKFLLDQGELTYSNDLALNQEVRRAA